MFWWDLPVTDYFRVLRCCVLFVQSLSCVWLSATPWTTAHQSPLTFTIYQSLLKLMSIESMMLSNHLILCRPLLLLPSIFPSIRVFSNKSALCIKWPKYWSFSFSISPSNEYSDWFSLDWLVWFPCSPGDSQESSPAPQFEASILWHSAFFMVQLSHPYMTTGKNYSFDKNTVAQESLATFEDHRKSTIVSGTERGESKKGRENGTC